MKVAILGVLAAALGLVVGLTLNRAAAQSALDPPVVAPHIFSLVFENERVRVLKVTERQGETQPLHKREDRVVVHLNSCAWTYEDDEGGTRMASYKPGDAYWRDAAVLGGRPPDQVQDCLLLEIELKEPQ